MLSCTYPLLDFVHLFKKAVSLDASLKEKAQKDLEFAKYQDAVSAL